MLKEAESEPDVAQFWHIPWPNRETFRVFPWKEELLDGMLGNDLLGFHLRYHCINSSRPWTADWRRGRTPNAPRSARQELTQVRAFPISIDFDGHDREARHRDVDEHDGALARLRWSSATASGRRHRPRRLHQGHPGAAPRRSTACSNTHPEYRGRLMFLQVGVPSRDAHRRIPASSTRRSTTWPTRSTGRWGTGAWRPIVFVQRHSTGRADGAAPAAGFLHRELAPRRHEPGCQGVLRQPVRRGRRAHPEPFHRRGAGDDGGSAGQSVLGGSRSPRPSTAPSKWAAPRRRRGCAACAPPSPGTTSTPGPPG